jgi:N-acetylglucosaminyl-diphospho-decaprenol L-rhamnosyltransferase
MADEESMATESYRSRQTIQGQGQPLLLSIIIINWNTCDLLADCLDSLATEIAHFPAGQVETLVIDNASSDDSVAMVQTHFPWVQLHQNPTNVGFAAANNQAMQVAQGRYLYLLNSDTQVLANALTTLVNFMEAHPKVGAVGSRYLNPDGSLQPSCYPAPTLARELWRLFHLDRFYTFGVYPVNSWSMTMPRAVDIVQGASLLLRHTVLKEVGAFDTDYFMYTEEVDLCHRIRQAGWSIFFVPISSIIHYGGQSTRQAALGMFLQLYRSKVLYFRKHHGVSTATVYKFILFAATIMRLLLTPLAWLKKPTQRHHYLTLATYYRQLALTLPAM